MILDEQGAKLSKRTGAADVMQYRDAGYLPHALLNYLVRLGWSHGDQEIFSIAEMTALFDLKDVNAKASRLDPGEARLAQPAVPEERRSGEVGKHLNGICAGGLRPGQGPAPADLVVALRDRVQTLKDMAERAAVWFEP